MDQDVASVWNITDRKMVAEPGGVSLFQFIPAFGDTGDSSLVLFPWKLDGGAYLFVTHHERSICALQQVGPNKY